MNMDWGNIITIIVTTLTGGFGGWFFGRRKYNAEAATNEVQNFDAAIEAYKKLYENREEIYQTQIRELKEENAALKQEIGDLRKQVLTVSNFVTAYMIKGQHPNLDEMKILSDITQE